MYINTLNTQSMREILGYKIKDLQQNADYLGLLVFLILFIYFWNIPQKTKFEIFLTLIVVAGFIVDTFFVMNMEP